MPFIGDEWRDGFAGPPLCVSAGMRIHGLDIHRGNSKTVAWEDGKLKQLGCANMRSNLPGAFAANLSPDDVVVIEATRAHSHVWTAPFVQRLI